MGKHRKGGASERLIAWAVGFSRPAKRLIMLTADGAMIPLALATAIWLKLGPAFSGIGTSPWLYIAALGTLKAGAGLTTIWPAPARPA